MFTTKLKTLLSTALLFILVFTMTSCLPRKFNASMGGADNEAHFGYNDGDETYNSAIGGNVIINGNGQGIIGGDGNVIIDENGNKIIIQDNQIIVNGEVLDSRFQVQYGPDGNILLVPREDVEANPPTETEEERETVRLPNGLLVFKDDVTYLEDGTIVRRFKADESYDYYEHTCYFPDGTIANVCYYDQEYNNVNYADAYEICASYIDINHQRLKDEYYVKENMFLYRVIEYVYSKVQEGTDDSPIYLSSKIYTYTSEDGLKYKTVEEFDPLHGDQKPYLKTYYDENGNIDTYTEYKYSLSGMLEKVTERYADGSIFHLKSYYSNGNVEYTYYSYPDGTLSEEFYDENGQRTLYKYVYTHGGTNTIHYENGIPALGEIKMSDGKYTQTFYDEQGTETKSIMYNPYGSIIQIETYEYNEPPAYSKIYIHNANNVLIGLTEYLSDDHGWVYSLETYYYENGNVKTIIEHKDFVQTRCEEYDNNGNRTN